MFGSWRKFVALGIWERLQEMVMAMAMIMQNEMRSHDGFIRISAASATRVSAPTSVSATHQYSVAREEIRVNLA